MVKTIVISALLGAAIGGISGYLGFSFLTTILVGIPVIVGVNYLLASSSATTGSNSNAA